MLIIYSSLLMVAVLAMASINAEATYSYRLVSSVTNMDGILEIKPDSGSTWGTVCSNSFKENTYGPCAACHSLGFLDTVDSYFISLGSGNRSLPIWLDQVTCTNVTYYFDNCTSKPLGENQCTHGDDSGVRCVAKPINWQFKLVNGSIKTRGVVMFRPFPTVPWGTLYAAPFNTAGTGIHMRRALCRSLGFESLYPVTTTEYAKPASSVPTYLKTTTCGGDPYALYPYYTPILPYLNNCTFDGYIQETTWDHSESLQIWCDEVYLFDTLEVRLLNGDSPSNGQVQFRKASDQPWEYIASNALIANKSDGSPGDERLWGTHNRAALNAICHQAGFANATNALFRYFGVWPVGGLYPPPAVVSIDCTGRWNMSACNLTRSHDDSLYIPGGVDCFPDQTEQKEWEYRLYNPNAQFGYTIRPSMGVAQMRLKPDGLWGSITTNETNNFGLWDSFCTAVGYGGNSSKIYRDLGRFTGGGYDWTGRFSTEFMPALISKVDCDYKKPGFQQEPICVSYCADPNTTTTTTTTVTTSTTTTTLTTTTNTEATTPPMNASTNDTTSEDNNTTSTTTIEKSTTSTTVNIFGHREAAERRGMAAMNATGGPSDCTEFARLKCNGEELLCELDSFYCDIRTEVSNATSATIAEFNCNGMVRACVPNSTLASDSNFAFFNCSNNTNNTNGSSDQYITPSSPIAQICVTTNTTTEANGSSVITTTTVITSTTSTSIPTTSATTPTSTTTTTPEPTTTSPCSGGLQQVWICQDGYTLADYYAQIANEAKTTPLPKDCSRSPTLSSLSIPGKVLALDCDTGAKLDLQKWQLRMNTTASLVEFRPSTTHAWGAVCTNDVTTLRALCHLAGHTNATYVEWISNQAVPASGNVYESAPTYLYNLRCPNGTSSFANCTFDHLEAESCDDRLGAVDCFAVPNDPSQWKFRLVGGPDNSSGRIEILPVSYSTWGTICDDAWNQPNNVAICQSLGFNTTGRIMAPRRRDLSAFGYGTGQIWIDDAYCSRRPFEYFQNCSPYLWRYHNCGHNEDVAVECLPPIPNYTHFKFRGVQVDAIDNPAYYRIEVMPTINGTWGTIYQSETAVSTLYDPLVACHTIGYLNTTYAEHIGAASKYQDTSKKVVIANYHCPFKNETSLHNCTPDMQSFMNPDLSHGYDWIVDCNAVYDDRSQWQFRLVGGPNNASGRLEIKPLPWASWGTVCDDAWNARDSKAACMSLGFNYTERVGRTGVTIPPRQVDIGLYGYGSGQIWLDDMYCNNLSVPFDYLQNCTVYIFKFHNCGHGEDIALQCEYPVYYPEKFQYRFIQQDPNIPKTGRIEMRPDNESAWGTIYQSARTTENVARAACMSVGFTDVHAWYSTTYSGSGPVYVMNWDCPNNATHFLNCSFDGAEYAVTTSHSYDLTVECDYATNTPSQFEFRLTNGTETFGRLEMRPAKWAQWGTIGGNVFSTDHAVAACRSAGFTEANGYSPINAQYTTALSPAATGRVWMHYTYCTDRPFTYFQNCTTYSWRYSNSHTNDVWLDCKPWIQVKLVDGPTNQSYRGRVMVKFNNWTNVWGTVCNDDFIRNHYSWLAACRSAGFTNTTRAEFEDWGPGTGAINLDDTWCEPDAKNINDCTYRQLGTSNCAHSEDSGLNCMAPEINETDWQFRLTGTGSTTTAGRIEMRPSTSDEWGVICMNLFNHTFTAWTAACRTVGIETLRARYRSFGAGYGPIYLDNVNCTDAATTLRDCSTFPIGSYDCSPTDAAGVDCDPAAEEPELWSFRLEGSSVITNNIYGIQRYGFRTSVDPTNTTVTAGTFQLQFSSSEKWGTVCSDGVVLQASQRQRMAAIFCRSAGVFDATRPPRMYVANSSIFTISSAAPTILSGVSCPIGAVTLADCTNNPIYSHTCSHSQDVQLDCLPSDPQEALAPEPALVKTCNINFLFSIDIPITDKRIRNGDITINISLPDYTYDDSGNRILSRYEYRDLYGQTNATALLPINNSDGSLFYPDIGSSVLSSYIRIYDANVGTNEPKGFRYTYGPRGQNPTTRNYGRRYNGRVYCEVLLRRTVQCVIPQNADYDLASSDNIIVEIMPELTLNYVYPSCTNRPIVYTTTTAAPTEVYTTTAGKTDAPTTSGTTVPPPTTTIVTTATTTTSAPVVVVRGFAEQAITYTNGEARTSGGSLSGGFSFAFAVTADTPSPLAAVVDAFGPIAGVVGLVAAIVGGSSPSDMQIIALLTQSFCMAEVDRKSTSILRYFISPLFDQGYAAIAYGNIGVTVLFALGQFALARHLINSRRLQWIDGWAATRFPSYSYAVAQLFFVGVCYGSLSLVNGMRLAPDTEEGHWATYFLGAIGCLVMVGILATIVYISMEVVVAKYVQYTQFLSIPWYRRWLYPLGFWENENQRVSFGFLLNPFRHGQKLKLFATASFLTTLITSLIMLLDFIPCFTRLIIVGVAFAATGLLYLLLQPSRCPPNTGFIVTAQFVMATLSFMSAQAFNEPTVGLMNGKLVFSFIQILLIIIRSIFSIAIRVLEHVRWRKFRTKDMSLFQGDEELQDKAFGSGAEEPLTKKDNTNNNINNASLSASLKEPALIPPTQEIVLKDDDLFDSSDDDFSDATAPTNKNAASAPKKADGEMFDTSDSANEKGAKDPSTAVVPIPASPTLKPVAHTFDDDGFSDDDNTKAKEPVAPPQAVAATADKPLEHTDNPAMDKPAEKAAVAPSADVDFDDFDDDDDKKKEPQTENAPTPTPQPATDTTTAPTTNDDEFL